MERKSKPAGLRTRLAVEERFHDQMALQKDTCGGYFYSWGITSHSIAYAKSLLGDLQGKHVLDLGCGMGEASVEFAERGATVQAIDISSAMVKEVQQRARAWGLNNQISVAKMAGEDLVFPDNTFDLIFGQSILHHLDMHFAQQEIKRVLKPGRKAVFIEPLNYSPFLNLFRRLTPWRRSKTEKPLNFDNIESLAEGFSSWRHREFYLLTILAVFFPWKPLFQHVMGALYRLDQLLLDAFPALRKYCWVVVIELIK